MAESAHTRPRRRHALILIALALALTGALTGPAWADQPVTAGEDAANAALPGRTLATSPRVKPPGFEVTAGQAARTAARLPQVRRELARGGLEREVFVPAYLNDNRRWVVTYSRDGTGVVEVELSGRTGKVLKVWTGPQVDFLLARPHKENMGHALNAAWIWIPLCLLFVAPFFDPKRPFRLLHLDLLVLLSFGIAQLLFNDGKLYVWVPAVYPVLAYLFVRLLLAGLRPRERVEPLIPYARESWLLAGLVLLLIGRVVLNVVDSSVIDVGYTTVVGADRVVHGVEVAGYGPLMFLAYAPFEWLFPWHGPWDSVPAAHAASLTFDALLVMGLALLGRRLRPGREGRTLGLALAYAWVAFPYSTYVLQANTNDGFVPMLLVFALLALTSAARSGALLGVATAAKIFPVVLAPLLVVGRGDRGTAGMVRFAAAFAGVVAVSIVAFLPSGGPLEMWDSTIGFQISRESPFSLWGLHPSLGWIQACLEVGVAGLCALLLVRPRRRDLRQIAALAGAVIVGLQLCTNYWLFTYVSWFAPLALVAMLGAYRSRLAEPEPARAAPEPRELARPDRHEARIRPSGGPRPAGVLTVERSAPATQRVSVALLSTTVLLSAGLALLLPPMVTRLALPVVGGAPAAWTTAVAFFQAVVLLAVVYARWSVRRFGARRQAALHLALVGAGLFLLPFGMPGGTPPAYGSPVPWLLLTMLVTVGLPFFVVAASVPVLGAWGAASGQREVSRLRRAGIAGAAAGLLAYPLLVEPRLSLDGQSWLWAGAYGVLMTLLVACAVTLWRSRAPAAEDARREPVAPGRRLRWTALAFVPSSLMLAITATLTAELAPLSVLWVLPLAAYLASFALAFAPGGAPRRFALAAAPAALVVMGGLTVLGETRPLLLIGALYLAGLLVVAVACHGELAADRESSGLLGYVALGAALGGAFNALIAPSLFNAPTELPLALVLMAFLLPFRAGSWTDQISARSDLLPPVLVGGATFGLLQAVGEGGVLEWLVLGAAALACLSLIASPLRFGIAVGLAMAAVWAVGVDDAAVIHQERDAFGVSRVVSPKGAFEHVLESGDTLRASQLVLDPRRPTTYYDRNGPMGQLLDGLPDRDRASRAAIVGLGAGTIACLARPADRWTFFEVDPAVVRLARDKDLFTYLRDCPGSFDVKLGDGRRSLAERPDREFGLVVIDELVSGALPVHLLTREAVHLYVRKLAPHGVIAFNVSSPHFDLAPGLGNVAQANGLTCYAQTLGSRWVVMSRTPADLGRAAHDRRWQACASDADARTWSDDYSNVTANLHLG